MRNEASNPATTTRTDVELGSVHLSV
jgi:hypothetical protein